MAWDRGYSGTVSHAKSLPAFLKKFLQSCETIPVPAGGLKPGMRIEKQHSPGFVYSWSLHSSTSLCSAVADLRDALYTYTLYMYL